MSNELLKNIYDPENDIRYIVGDASLSEEGAAADAKKTGYEISAINSDIESIATIKRPLDLINYPYSEGYLTTGGVFVPDTHTTQKTTDPIYLSNGEYTVDFEGVYNGNPNYYVRAIAVYNSSDVCTRYYNSGTLKNFTVLDTDSYVRINANANTITEYLLYLTETGGETVVKINHGIIDTDPTLKMSGEPADSKSVGDMFNEIATFDNGIVVDESYSDWTNGYINVFTGELIPTTNTQHTTDFIELEPGVSYGFVCNFVINNTVTTQPRAIVTYNEDESFSRSISPKTTITNIALTGSEKYVRININYDTLNAMSLFKNKVGSGNKMVTLKGSTVIPQINQGNYTHARRPLIAFILDGDYNLNSSMESVFSNHGVCSGFAIPYTEAFSINPISTYFDWERKGHEILSHSAVAVGLNGSATDEQIAKIVKDSHDVLIGYGFNIHGFVAYQGSTKPVTVENVKKWFDYGCDALNHSASQESCMFFGTDDPYMLWRYSMQLSTLQEMKNAVDRCISEKGLLIFYGHANSTNVDNFTAENLDALLTYIESVNGTIKTPYDAITDYYSLRYSDIIQ